MLEIPSRRDIVFEHFFLRADVLRVRLTVEIAGHYRACKDVAVVRVVDV